MNRAIGKNKKMGIEISQWKVGDADGFRGLEQEEDYDVERVPSQYYEAEANDEQNNRLKSKPGRKSK